MQRDTQAIGRPLDRSGKVKEIRLMLPLHSPFFNLQIASREAYRGMEKRRGLDYIINKLPRGSGGVVGGNEGNLRVHYVEQISVCFHPR